MESDGLSGTNVPSVLRTFALTLLRGNRRTGLSRTAVGTLSTLEQRGPARITTLASLEAVTQPAMTGLVQRFETAGLVTRTDDPEDARASLIAITDDGLRLLAERRSAHEAAIAHAITHLPEEQHARLHEAVPAIVNLTENYAPET